MKELAAMNSVGSTLAEHGDSRGEEKAPDEAEKMHQRFPDAEGVGWMAFSQLVVPNRNEHRPKHSLAIVPWLEI